MRGKKRKRFANVFWGKFFWTTLVLAGLYLFGLSIFVTVNRDNCWNSFWEVENNRLNGIKEMAEEGMEDFARKQQFRGAIMAEGNQVVSFLYDAKTKEQIAGCEEQLVIIRSRSAEEPATMYCYPTADIPGWSEHRQKVMKLKKESNLINENIEMTYFYQKGEEVIPGPFTVSVSVTDLFDYEIATDGYEPEHALVSTFDMSGAIPEEYEQKEIGVGDFKLTPIVVGYSTTNPWMQYYGGVDWAYELLQREYAAVKYDGREATDLEERTFFTLTMQSYSEVDLENGQTVALLSVAYYDLWETYKTIFTIIAVALLAFDAVLALILAKLTYAQIKAQYRMEDYRKNLMNTMAHDLKSPLMSISGYAENLENNMAPGKQEHYAKAIQDNVKYMNQVIESVLELSKIEKSGIVLKKESIKLKLLLEEAQQKYNLQMKEKNLTIEIEGEISVKADKNLMLQVLDNLLGNAVKYATPGSAVKVVLGSGKMQMSNPCSEDLSSVVNTLCEPFVVGNESRSGKQGSGLGLAIVKNICELHGYRLQVEYRDGCFTVRITNL